jgi:phospholipid/cholesterol/gamma-HCH transport system substrate-binding protein
MGGLKTEVKVGIFVVLGLIFLAYMTINIEKIQVGKERGYNIYAVLDTAQGLVKNTTVKTAGVEIGRITDISLTDSRARLTINLPYHIKLRRDAKAYVKMESLLGEKFLEIDPGTPGIAELKPGDEIQQGAPPPDMDRLIVQLNSIAADIKSVTQPFSEVLGGKEGKDSIKNIVDNIKEAASGLSGMIKDNDEKIGRIITNVDKFTNDLPALSSDAKELIASLNNISKKMESGEGTLGRLVNDDTLYKEAKNALAGVMDTMDNISRVSKNIEAGEGSLGKLIKDPALYNEVKDTFLFLKTTFIRTKDVLDNLNKLAEDLRGGKGSLGKLMTDDAFYNQINATMESLNNIAKKIESIAKKIERGEGTIGKLINDETLYTEAKKALKGVTKATEGINEQIPISILGTVIGTAVQ